MSDLLRKLYIKSNVYTDKPASIYALEHNI